MDVSDDQATTRGASALHVLSKLTATVEEAAVVLGVAPWTLRRAIRTGEAPVPIIRVGRRIVVPVGPLRALLGLDPNP